jgi:hypothetical protein
MIEGRDIVCFSFGAWDDMVETPQYLMTRIASPVIDAISRPQFHDLLGFMPLKGSWQ